jgi:RecB family exonuclease
MAQAAGRDAIAPIHYLLGARPDEFGRVWRRQTARWAEPGVTAHDGWCETDEAIAALEKTLAEKDAWSVSEIEQFARCPRRYLFAELLGLESPEDPEAVVSLPADKRGSLLHKLLEETAGDPATPVDARVAEDYGALAEQNLTGGGALDQAERERLTAWAHAMLDFIERQSGGAEPVAVEEKFDAEIELGGMKVKLRLRPDRVERNADGALRIIDYKTGKAVGCFARDKGLRDNGFNGGSTLQLPLYLLAWLESHGWDASEKLSAAYWHLKDKKGAVDPTAVEFSVQFAREQLPKLRDALREIIEDVRRARFAPRPDVAAASGNAYCGNCPYRVICDGRGRAQLAAKAKRPGVRPCPWLDAIGRIDDE